MRLGLPALLLIFVSPPARAAEPPAQAVLSPIDDERIALEPFFTAEQLDSFEAREKTVLAQAAGDPAWPQRSTFFLQELHDPPIHDWTLLSDAHKGAVLREWARYRLDALDAARQVRLSAHPNQDQARQIRLLADAGFLTADEVAPLSQLKGANGLPLLAAASLGNGGSPETQSTAAGRQFGQAGSRVLLRGDNDAPTALFSDQPAPGAESAYATAKSMILDPDGFAQDRPELFASEDGHGAARARLRQQLGHVFAAADALRAQRRLFFEAGPLPRDGSALGDIARVSFHYSPGNESAWTVVVRIKDAYFNEDTALLGPVLAHELQHVYDIKRIAERYGPQAAARLGDYSEQEQRAFAAQTLVDEAYSGPLQAAYALRKTSPAWLVFTSHKKMLAVAALRDDDPADFLAELKDLAARDLRARSAGRAPWHDLASLEKSAADAAARIEQDSQHASGEHRVFLRRELKRERGVLRAISEEKRRGLGLT